MMIAHEYYSKYDKVSLFLFVLVSLFLYYSTNQQPRDVIEISYVTVRLLHESGIVAMWSLESPV